MKLNFSQELLDFEGAALPDGEDQVTLANAANVLARLGDAAMAETVFNKVRAMGTNGATLTLKKVCIRALGAGVQGEKNPEQMLRLFELGNTLRPGGEIEIATEDATTLKELVAKAFKSPLVAGQAAKMLNG